MKNNRGSLTIIAIFTVLIFSLYGVLLYARSASAYIRQSKSIETIQAIYAQDVPNAARIAEQLGATSTYVGEYYTITINADNGSEITSFSLMPGELVSRPRTPEKSGYGFDNWYYTNASGVEEVFDFTVAPTSDVNIFAKYTGEAVMMSRNNNKSFWQEEYRTKITSIQFIKDEFENIPEDAILLDDVQQNGNYARIAAYTESDGAGGLALTVLSPNTIYANSNARYYFSSFLELKTINFINFYTSKTTDMFSMFSSCSKLIKMNLNTFNTNSVKNMQQMFWGDNCLEELDLSTFNTSQVTTIYGMFNGCNSLKSLDVSNFDISKVTSLYGMFEFCSNITELDVSNFNTSKVTNFQAMFNGCSKLIHLNVSGFSTNEALTLQQMFANCEQLTFIDTGGFHTSKVKSMSMMFSGCSKLESLDLSNFETDQVTNMFSMFQKCSSLTTIYAKSDWNIENVTQGTNMFYQCNKLVGENGTTYSGSYGKEYARIDTSETPGYFTLKSN